MAWRQYTSCVSPDNYVDFSFNLDGLSNTALLLLSMGFIAFLLASLLGGPTAIWIAIAVDTALIIYFYWWLHGRLICLGGVQCLIGVIASLGPSDPVKKGGDNDFTMDLLLAPAPTNYTFPNDEYWQTQQGQLIVPNPLIFAIGRGYALDDGHKEYILGLHCEFEGDGIYTLLLEAIIIFALLLAALIFPQAAVALGILAALIFLIGLLGDWLLNTPGGLGAGSPTDIDPGLGTLTSGDIVVVKGDWIYDSLHPGWNEIHAVHACQKVGESIVLPGRDDLKNPMIPPTPWPPDLQAGQVQSTLDMWCSRIQAAEVAEQGGSRDDPQNDWVIHPLIDGCNPVVIV